MVRITSYAVACVLTVMALGASAQPSFPGTALNGRSGAHSALASTIQGNALSPTDGRLPFVPIRLRDVRFGRIVGTTTTDRAGIFLFRGVEPGSYVVELMDREEATLAASQILNVNAGEAVSTVVKLPYRVSQFAKVIGQTKASALTVLSAAAASGVLAAVVTGQPVSPGQ
jgi:hypothetical protein